MKVHMQRKPLLNLVKVPVTVNNNSEYFLLVDIGASMTTFNLRFAEILEIKVLDEITEAHTAHGKMEHQFGMVDSLEFKGLKFTDVKVRLGKHKLDEMIPKEEKILGVIGFDIFKQYILEIDYKKEEAPQVQFKEQSEKSLDSGDFYKFNYIRDYLITLQVNLNNHTDIDFIIDTGASGSVLNKSTVDELNISEIESDAYAVSPKGKTKVTQAKINFIKTPFHDKKEKMFVIMPLDHLTGDSNKKLGGILGYDFLRGRKLIINYPDQQILIK